MKRLLLITCSSRGEGSLSSKLSRNVTDRLAEREEKIEIVERDLCKNPLAHPSPSQISVGNYKPLLSHTADDQLALKTSDEIVDEVTHADLLVIGTPMYNFSIPSTLKAWIDHLVRPGRTFHYTNEGPRGLLHHKKAYLVISSGGIYSTGPFKDFDFSESYLRSILSFIGITDVNCFRVEGTAIPEMANGAYKRALKAINETL